MDLDNHKPLYGQLGGTPGGGDSETLKNTLSEYKYLKDIYCKLYFKDPKFNIIKTIKYLDEKEK